MRCLVRPLVWLAGLSFAACAEGEESSNNDGAASPQELGCEAPKFSRDGREVSFSCQDSYGASAIYSFEIDSAIFRLLTGPSPGYKLVDPGPRTTGGVFSYLFCLEGDRNDCQVRISNGEDFDQRLSPNTISAAELYGCYEHSLSPDLSAAAIRCNANLPGKSFGTTFWRLSLDEEGKPVDATLVDDASTSAGCFSPDGADLYYGSANLYREDVPNGQGDIFRYRHPEATYTLQSRDDLEGNRRQTASWSPAVHWTGEGGFFSFTTAATEQPVSHRWEGRVAYGTVDTEGDWDLEGELGAEAVAAAGRLLPVASSQGGVFGVVLLFWSGSGGPYQFTWLDLDHLDNPIRTGTSDSAPALHPAGGLIAVDRGGRIYLEGKGEDNE